MYQLKRPFSVSQRVLHLIALILLADCSEFLPSNLMTSNFQAPLLCGHRMTLIHQTNFSKRKISKPRRFDDCYQLSPFIFIYCTVKPAVDDLSKVSYLFGFLETAGSQFSYSLYITSPEG